MASRTSLTSRVCLLFVHFWLLAHTGHPRYQMSAAALRELKDQGIAAGIYTQATDVVRLRLFPAPEIELS